MSATHAGRLKPQTLSGVGRGRAPSKAGAFPPVTAPALNDKAPKDLKTFPSALAFLPRSNPLMGLASDRKTN